MLDVCGDVQVNYVWCPVICEIQKHGIVKMNLCSLSVALEKLLRPSRRPRSDGSGPRRRPEEAAVLRLDDS